MKNLDQLQKNIVAAIENSRTELFRIGEYIWKNPEPGYREVKTSAFLAEKLENLGLTVKKQLAMTGFRADIDTGRPGPTVAILGELDSLILPNHPEACKENGGVHACGHNASATALIGTAIGLLHSGALENMCGKIALIATPAEEGIELDYRKSLIDAGKIGSIAGKSQLLREGVFDDVDISYMQHLTTASFGYIDHNGCVNKRITFHGKSCHAASPQNGVNALNAANLALHAIALMRESFSNDPYVRIHGIMTNGGASVNIIPNVTTLEFMLRAPAVEKILALNERFDRVVLHAAAAAECTAEVETVNGYMPLYNDAELGAVLKNVVNELYPGEKFNNNETFASSCTDMGDVATVIPAIHGYVPGASGASHGITYMITDPESAYIRMSAVNAVMALKLLYGDAETGRKIAAHKADLMPIPEYIKIIDSINKTVHL